MPTHNASPALPAGRAVLVLSAAALLIASVVMIFGWGLGSVAVRSLQPGLAAMVPSTAFCFLVAAGLVLVHHEARPHRLARPATRVGAVVIGGIALIDLFAIVFTEANGIDMLLVPSEQAFRTASMAVATATSFLLLAVCLFRLDRPLEQNDLVFVVSATVGLVFSGIALTGYAFDTQALYEVSLFTAMALHTAVCFFVLFTALLLLRPDIGWVAILKGEEGGSAGARWLLPGAVVIPFILCLIALWATEGGLVNANFRLSVLAITMMVLLSATVLRYAAIQNAIERDLRAAVGDRELLLREVYHRVKNNLQMTNALLRLGLGKVEEEKSKSLIQATIKRVESLGIVHCLLISADVPSQLKADAYFEELCDNILDGQYEPGADVSIDVQAEERLLHVEAAVTLGLLINEIVTNALKHAFVGRESGHILVSFKGASTGEAVLAVADNGPGYDPTTTRERLGIGTQLIEGLVRQLDADMRIDTSDGTRFTITIPLETLEGRRYEG